VAIIFLVAKKSIFQNKFTCFSDVAQITIMLHWGGRSIVFSYSIVWHLCWKKWTIPKLCNRSTFWYYSKARVTPKTVYLEHLLTYWRRLMNDSYVGDYLVFKRGRKKSNGAILFIIDSNDLKIRFSNGLRWLPSSSCFALILLWFQL